ncbi:uncharacterized protein LOC129941272 isoform X1 [Eupeodes corollae]|uniref:uncharacterized protein LOC129941272 isoform X1 n=2 Tax=Eupeodes corollae TaxID=290404 RepID=UPI00248F72BB|nr:uncharacterized protein LOC129941272 isoform X1 [Eupeodes corollae]
MFKHEFYPIATLIAVLNIFCTKVIGHGMLLDPVSRSSRWRYDESAPKNYEDNMLNCGGADLSFATNFYFIFTFLMSFIFQVMWGTNAGECGLCGDDYSLPTPRPNELGGTFGEGVITKQYVNESQVELGIQVIVNQMGFFYFDICNLDEFHEESEDCFKENPILLADGSDKFYIDETVGWLNATVIFPPELNCMHCVLRWNYVAGNNWGKCEDGSLGLGCGPFQKNYKGCSDISIVTPSSRHILSLINNHGVKQVEPADELTEPEPETELEA